MKPRWGSVDASLNAYSVCDVKSHDRWKIILQDKVRRSPNMIHLGLPVMYRALTSVCTVPWQRPTGEENA